MNWPHTYYLVGIIHELSLHLLPSYIPLAQIPLVLSNQVSKSASVLSSSTT